MKAVVAKRTHFGPRVIGFPACGARAKSPRVVTSPSEVNCLRCRSTYDFRMQKRLDEHRAAWGSST